MFAAIPEGGTRNLASLFGEVPRSGQGGAFAAKPLDRDSQLCREAAIPYLPLYSIMYNEIRGILITLAREVR